MNQSHWLILVIVATMVCNGSCRPREVEITNIYPVYRSEKQLELETPNRYEKPFHAKPDGESLTYQRIDIPYKNVNDLTKQEIPPANNNSKAVDYVPVAITVKKNNNKKWPSDQNGIESQDDLSLYNIYTNNINPINLNRPTPPGFDFHFQNIPPSRPSIIILEELTPQTPFFDYPDNVFSPPIQVQNRPQNQFHHTTYRPIYTTELLPLPQRPITQHYDYYDNYEYPSTTHRPIHTTELLPIGPIYQNYNQQNYHEGPQPPGFPPVTPNPPIIYPEVPTKPIEQTTQQTTIIPIASTTPPETTTKKRKSTKCPNVSVIATNTINNHNGMNKEGCQDININIQTNINNTNTNTMGVRPLRPVNTSVVQNDSNNQIGIFGIFDSLWSIISRIFSFTFSSPFFTALLAPFSAFLAGGVSMTSLILPWFFPHLLLGRRNKLRKNNYLKKRSKRDVKLQLAFRGWSNGKKISRYRSEEPSSTVETKTEANKPPEPKINIESIATVARASSDGPSMPSPQAIGQLIDTVGQMVHSDIRTPPKLKEIIKEKVTENRRDALGESSTPLPYTFVYDEDYHKEQDKFYHSDFSEGKASHINVKMATDEGVKGIAIPVMMDDVDYESTAPPKKLQKIPEVPKPPKEEKKKNSVTKSQSTTTPSSGLSTWILLSDNKDVTTPSPKRNNNKKENGEKKGTASPSTTKKPIKLQTAAPQTNKKVTPKPNGKKPESEIHSMSALEAMVKNQKKNVATTMKPKLSEDTKSSSQKKTSDSKKKVTTERLEAAETKNKFEIELPESKNTLPTNLPLNMEEKAVTVPLNQNESQPTTETAVEGTTKKKTSSKKKKKNKNKRRKTTTDSTGVEAKIPSQPMGSQIYNFLSREIVPTVGLGLIGVALTAGLASFLGYNPFGSTTVPLRRTYESHHGYTPNNYYNYNTDYGDGGQSEEVLFREVLSGMPEDSRYGLTHTDPGYPEAYNRQDQVYDNMNNPVYPTTAGSKYNSEKDVGNYDATYPQDYSSAYGSTYDTQDKKYMSDKKDKYPVYNPDTGTGTSFVYPETTGMTSPEKTSRVNNDYVTQSSNSVDKYTKTNPDTIERQPEALYRVAGESEYHYRNGESTIQGVSTQNSWHRIGTPMEATKVFPHLEPGPRSLDLSKVSTKTEEKKRVKRAAESVIQKISPKRTKKANDVENEIDFEESISDKQNSLEDFSTTTTATRTTTYFTETTTSSPDTDAFSTSSTVQTTEEVKEASTSEPTETYEPDNDGPSVGPSGNSVLDVLKRLAQFKLRLGLNFLRSTTDMFSRYLDDIQRRVDESFTNTTTTTVQYNKRSPWSRIFSSFGDYRRRRSVLDEKQMLSDMLTEGDKTNDRSKSTKKDLGPSNKVFHQKKTLPKKYKSN